ncbi:hypothetical protein I302_105823 [Kwoniella bestiolae CBS 10118]|uniref:Uncharacterized protein n=1 Tax=Kwoniella bestiolae CBS 10118 TaxID=1296100 RepID=A0A1B9G2A0_9TREE|nr:hypothetical protein I302_04945 [Kwoniella bestiolae CBS 10118]OCF25135.1 hypothetical protein I302_04945 [Kwoniella bestiolae CBS 10118]
MRLPLEVIWQIAAQSHKSVLISFMRVSRELHTIAGPILYRTIYISRKTASRLLEGMIRCDVQFKVGDIVGGSFSASPCTSQMPKWILQPEPNESAHMPYDGDWHATVVNELQSRYSTFDKRFSRKSKLLNYCKKLVFVDLPTKAFWQDIFQLVFFNGGIDTKIPQAIFKNVRDICIMSYLVWNLVIWEERSSIDLDDHPFFTLIFTLIYQMTNPENICISLPLIGLQEFDEYSSALWSSSSDTVWTYRKIKSKFAYMVSGIYQVVVCLELEPQKTASTLSMHAASVDKLYEYSLQTPKKRIFVRHCACGTPWREEDCFQHLPQGEILSKIHCQVREDINRIRDDMEGEDTEILFEQDELHQEGDHRQSTEFILDSRIGRIQDGPTTMYQQKIELPKDMVGTFQATITCWSIAEDCVCCGGKWIDEA